MNAKTFIIRLIGLIAIALAGSFLYAVTFHVMVAMNLIPAELAEKAYGTILTHKTTLVWLGCVAISFISIFIKESWRYVFYLSPLYAPPLFAAAFTLIQQ